MHGASLDSCKGRLEKAWDWYLFIAAEHQVLSLEMLVNSVVLFA